MIKLLKRLKARVTRPVETAHELVAGDSVSLSLDGERVLCLPWLLRLGVLPSYPAQGTRLQLVVRRKYTPGFHEVKCVYGKYAAAVINLNGRQVQTDVFAKLRTIFPHKRKRWARLQPLPASASDDGIERLTLVYGCNDFFMDSRLVVCMAGLLRCGLMPPSLRNGDEVQVLISPHRVKGFTHVALKYHEGGRYATGIVGNRLFEGAVYRKLTTILPDGESRWVKFLIP